MGEEPPFHTPVFVLTHHPRPLVRPRRHHVQLRLGVIRPTSCHVLGRRPWVRTRLGGGAQTIRAFIDADLVDTLHVAVAPIELGSGSRLWYSPSELDDRFHRDEVPSPSGVVHHLLWRR